MMHSRQVKLVSFFLSLFLKLFFSPLFFFFPRPEPWWYDLNYFPSLSNTFSLFFHCSFFSPYVNNCLTGRKLFLWRIRRSSTNHKIRACEILDCWYFGLCYIHSYFQHLHYICSLWWRPSSCHVWKECRSYLFCDFHNHIFLFFCGTPPKLLGKNIHPSRCSTHAKNEKERRILVELLFLAWFHCYSFYNIRNSLDVWAHRRRWCRCYNTSAIRENFSCRKGISCRESSRQNYQNGTNSSHCQTLQGNKLLSFLLFFFLSFVLVHSSLSPSLSVIGITHSKKRVAWWKKTKLNPGFNPKTKQSWHEIIRFDHKKIDCYGDANAYMYSIISACFYWWKPHHRSKLDSQSTIEWICTWKLKEDKYIFLPISF